MGNRFEAAKQYLIDLLRAYGHRPIIVKVRMDGSEVEVMAKNMVKKQLTAAGILFPYGEGNKPNQRVINTAIDRDMLSVIFHEALFEFETAYIEANCKDNPRAARFIDSVYDWIERKQEWMKCTFPSYTDEELQPFLPDKEVEDESIDWGARKQAREFLATLGINSLESTDDINKIFWEMAVRRKPVSNKVRDAVRIALSSDRLRKVFNHNLTIYNDYFKAKSESPEFRDDEQLVKDVTKQNKKVIQEVEQLRSQLRKESNIEKQELKREESMSRKLVKKFMNMLKTNNTRFNRAYDLNNEADIIEFLSWYKMIKRPVNKKTIRDMSRLKCTEPGAEELFLRLVEEHNAEFGNVAEEIEESDD